MSKLRRLLIIGILTFTLVSACRGNAPQQKGSQAVRVVNHAMGKTKVPVNPQRVVVLSIGLDTVLSLGVKPVGSIQVERDDYYLKNKAEGVESVGNFSSPNLVGHQVCFEEEKRGNVEGKKRQKKNAKEEIHSISEAIGKGFLGTTNEERENHRL